MSSRVARFLLASALVAAAFACNTPKDAHEGATIPVASVASASAPAPASAPASASASAPAPAPAPASASPAKCTADADCRTWSSYCTEAPCACRVLAATDGDPKCLGGGAPKVRCLVDPCARKVASCQSGACVLTAK